jgi:hypothetical protein
MITDDEIRAAVETLRKGELDFRKKVTRHYQHKKAERQKWAVYGCDKCLALIDTNNN